ncbi:MAG: 2OG-Fe(II) oxygenase [Betaproteobacteria bacterium]|nr:2OG-Fe(II) oxygenase [Betaproteobacteria bacterium]
MGNMRSTSPRPPLPPSEMADLFGEPALPEGFRYAPGVLSPAEERGLVRQFEKLALQPYQFHGYEANRRIFTFGRQYIFAGQHPREDARIPDYLQPLAEIASRISGMPAAAFQQVMVTEYTAGAGIGWHRDKPHYEDVVGLSFLAPCVFRFRRKAGEAWERRAALVEPRSAYLLHGPARETWQHSIAPMDVLRYSVTLRTLRPGKASPTQK